nr:unnamed protein product [Callosobruchus chinensis]
MYTMGLATANQAMWTKCGSGRNGNRIYVSIQEKTTTNETFFVSKVVHIKFIKEKPGMMYFKTSFSQEEFDQIDYSYNRDSRRITRQIGDPCISDVPTLLNIRNGPKPISTKKYRDLQKLLKWVPKDSMITIISFVTRQLKRITEQLGLRTGWLCCAVR